MEPLPKEPLPLWPVPPSPVPPWPSQPGKVLCEVGLALDEEAAVSMPTTSPAELTSEPPESPGSIGALDWISPVSCSELPEPSSLAVMAWFSPVTVPDTTEGVPPLPSALPMATTLSPTLTEELASVTVCRFEAPCSWSTAMSLLAS